MAKQSPAKIKVSCRSQAGGSGKSRREKANKESSVSNNDDPLDAYESVDGYWREIGLAAPARRALMDDGLFQLSDLRKVSLAAIKELQGMAPNAIRVLVAEMKKADLSFRK